MTKVRLYREGLRQLLAGEQDIEVVGTASPSDPVAELCRDRAPTVAVIDASVILETEIARSCAQTAPAIRIVALAITEEDEEEVLGCAAAGVAGFVSCEAALEDLAAIVRTAARGETSLSHRVSALLLQRISDLGSAGVTGGRLPPPSLTSRELEVVELIADGLSNKAIAGQLGIELTTVKNHVHRILEKCGVHRRSDVAAFSRAWLGKRRGGATRVEPQA